MHSLKEFVDVMSALTSDLVAGRVSPSVGSAIARRASQGLRRTLAQWSAGERRHDQQ